MPGSPGSRGVLHRRRMSSSQLDDSLVQLRGPGAHARRDILMAALLPTISGNTAGFLRGVGELAAGVVIALALTFIKPAARYFVLFTCLRN